MSYVEQNVSPGENIRFTGQVHWWIYVGPLVLVFLGLAVLALEASIPSTEASPLPVLLGTVLFVIGAVKLISGLVYAGTTELTVTDRKVIGKWGFIRRDTIEQRLETVDATLVHQSLFGRLFNFGNIVVRGSGTTNTPIRMIAKPLDFRKAVDAGVAEFETRVRKS
ncbi:MAG TPA: PH domain-containing protein [Rhizomicrobium sp.]|nr:PH domain-containing protein [Rhizomicrobium sp.]